MFPLAALVLAGLDVLVKDDFRLLEGRKVGLITNHTGRTLDGRHAADLFHASKNLELVALFAPEHGLRGERDETIGDEVDKATGLPVYSLYNLKEKGEARYKPSKEQLKGIDTLVFDIQDIGARFYTYTSTMGYAMEAAAENNIRFVVLDRPNPINGIKVEGNASTDEFKGITAYFPVATRHGMTAGEMAMMFKAERKLDLDLQVVWADGWRRSMWLDETGLPWINPSPNMRTMNAAVLYPGLCLLEATNVSMGRGTDLPFERIGAPWMDGVLLASALNGMKLPGISAHPVRFKPTASKFAGEECGGIQFVVTDRNKLDSVKLGFELARMLRRLFPQWQPEGFVRLVQNRKAAEAILPDSVGPRPEWNDGLAAFKRIRSRYLYYR